jgi:hypothetical protein
MGNNCIEAVSAAALGPHLVALAALQNLNLSCNHIRLLIAFVLHVAHADDSYCIQK